MTIFNTLKKRERERERERETPWCVFKPLLRRIRRDKEGSGDGHVMLVKSFKALRTFFGPMCSLNQSSSGDGGCVPNKDFEALAGMRTRSLVG